MNPERLVIRNAEGNRLSALLFVPADERRCTVIAAHGFRGTKENGGRICSLAAKLVSRGCALLAFDFAGSGESEGDFADITLSGQVRDLQAVVDWSDSRGLRPVVLLGRSFGGSTVLAEAAGDERVRGIILWSTPVWLRETFAAIMPAEYRQLEEGNSVWIRDDWGEFRLNPGFARDLAGHDMSQYIKSISRRPVLIIHGQSDEIVKPENAEYIYERVGEQAELHLVEGSDHRFLNSSALREDLTVAWLERYFLQAPAVAPDSRER